MLCWPGLRLKSQVDFDTEAINHHHAAMNTSAIKLPGQTQSVRAFGDEITFLLEGKHTGGQFTMFLVVTQPGDGPPPHYHKSEDEWFYVLESTASFFADGKWSDVPVGGAVFVPKNCVHRFKNNTDRPLKMLVHTSPSGFETFFRKAAEEFAKPGGPDMDRVMQISGEHDIFFV